MLQETSCYKHHSQALFLICDQKHNEINPVRKVADFKNVPRSAKWTINYSSDVTYPSPTENGIPSIAAVVASMDANATKYCARVRAQNHKNGKGAQEIINDLPVMVMVLAPAYYAHLLAFRARHHVTGNGRFSLFYLELWFNRSMQIKAMFRSSFLSWLFPVLKFSQHFFELNHLFICFWMNYEIDFWSKARYISHLWLYAK